MTKFVCLAGGKGSRMMPLTNYLKKEMYPLLDKPFLEYSLMELVAAKVTDNVVFAVDELGHEQLFNYFGNQYENLSIEYVDCSEDLNNRQAIQRLFFVLENDLVVWHGDTWIDRETFKNLNQQGNKIAVHKTRFRPQFPIIARPTGTVIKAFGCQEFPGPYLASSGAFRLQLEQMNKFFEYSSSRILEAIQKAINNRKRIKILEMPYWIHLGPYDDVSLRTHPEDYQKSLRETIDFFAGNNFLLTSAFCDGKMIVYNSSVKARNYYERSFLDGFHWPIVATAYCFKHLGKWLVALVKRSGVDSPGKWALLSAGAGNNQTEFDIPEYALKRELCEELIIQSKAGRQDPLHSGYRYPKNEVVMKIKDVNWNIMHQAKGHFYATTKKLYYLQVWRSNLPADKITLFDGEMHDGKPLERTIALVPLDYESLTRPNAKVPFVFNNGVTFKNVTIDCTGPQADTVEWLKEMCFKGLL